MRRQIQELPLPPGLLAAYEAIERPATTFADLDRLDGFNDHEPQRPRKRR
jgi:hypothetical protein